ncbi:MAG: nicotinamide riboside transporter PnuC [Marinifilaceae bacterium]
MVLEWLTENYIEVLGTVAGLIYLYLEIKQKIWLWPLGIITSALYVYVFFTSKFYADMGLQVYYLVVSVYGWYFWLKGKSTELGEKLCVTHITPRLFLSLFGVNALIYAFLVYVLVNFTDSPLPYWDAFTTSLSIVATWMLARKILEQWLVWVVVNAVSLGLYLYKGLYPTSVLFLFYTSMAVVGYYQWKKDMLKSGSLPVE